MALYDINLEGDAITQNLLPLEIQAIYSRAAEMAAEPYLAYDDSRWCEQKGEFKAERSQNIYWTTYRGILPAIEPLSETADKKATGFTEFQTSFTVNEYGKTIKWTRLAETFHYTDPSLPAKVQSILGPNMGLTRDVLCRNAMVSGLQDEGRVTYLSASARSAVPANGYLKTSTCSSVSDMLLEENFLQDGQITVIGHRRAFRGVMDDPLWKDAQYWAGVPDLMTKSLIGGWQNVKFYQAANAVLPNAGAVEYSTTLAANVTRGQTYFMATSTEGMEAGDTITVGTPGGLDEDAEEVTIKTINAGTGRVDIAKKGGFKEDHALGTAVTEGLDIYPVIFLLNGQQPFGRGDVISPTIMLRPPIDDFGRLFRLSWYGLFGYGVIRPWFAYMVECAAPKLTIA